MGSTIGIGAVQIMVIQSECRIQIITIILRKSGNVRANVRNQTLYIQDHFSSTLCTSNSRLSSQFSRTGAHTEEAFSVACSSSNSCKSWLEGGGGCGNLTLAQFHACGVAKTVQESRRVSTRSDDPNAGPDLPTELLELIFSKLNLKDNILASAVCKRWLAVAVSLRTPNNAPWLMSFPTSGSWYQFYDPSSRKMYVVEYPELRSSRICYAKDGWLVAFKPRTRRVFFFHPYTRELIKLAKRQQALENVAFSAAPTSPTCFLLTMENVAPTVVAISMCRPGAAAWTNMTFHNNLPFISSIWNKVVFSKGLFYCLSLHGMLGIFDPVNRGWTVTTVLPPKCTDHLSVEHWRRGKFMAEHDGDIFVVYSCANLLPFVYKLDKERVVGGDGEFRRRDSVLKLSVVCSEEWFPREYEKRHLLLQGDILWETMRYVLPEQR